MTRYILLHRLETPEEIIRSSGRDFSLIKRSRIQKDIFLPEPDKKKPILDFKQTAIEA